MTEHEWLSAATVIDLDLWRSAKNQHRKWRLFAAACCRRAIVKSGDGRLDPVAEIAESFADGKATWDEMKRIRKVLAVLRKEIGDDHFGPKESLRDTVDALDAATAQKPVLALGAAEHAEYAFRSAGRGHPSKSEVARLSAAEEREQIQLARDIFGNPFRPVTFDPVWRTADTSGIAARMYETRDFSAMPILADALEEAGCTNPDILLHAREPGVHVRGCWVVDLVLGKS